MRGIRLKQSTHLSEKYMKRTDCSDNILLEELQYSITATTMELLEWLYVNVIQSIFELRRPALKFKFKMD